MSKFDPLRKYLSESGKQTVTLSFDELESKDILGQKLPESSRSHRAYFANTSTHSIAKAWLDAGYRVASVDQNKHVVVFEKIDQAQDYLLSADVFEQRISTKMPKGGKAYISVYTLYETIFFRGHYEKPVYQTLLEQNITILEMNGHSVDFDLFQKKTMSIRASLMSIYNSAILYSLINCFISISEGQQRERIIGLFSVENEDCLSVIFPITPNIDDWNAVFKTIIRKVSIKTAHPGFTYESVVQKIGALKYSSMSLFVPSDISYPEINYFNFTLKEFIASCKRQKPFIPFAMLNEMLNMMIMGIKKNLLYITATDNNFDILIGSIKNRVIKKTEVES